VIFGLSQTTILGSEIDQCDVGFYFGISAKREGFMFSSERIQHRVKELTALFDDGYLLGTATQVMMSR
jgi:hypothetical protein